MAPSSCEIAAGSAPALTITTATSVVMAAAEASRHSTTGRETATNITSSGSVSAVQSMYLTSETAYLTSETPPVPTTVAAVTVLAATATVIATPNATSAMPCRRDRGRLRSTWIAVATPADAASHRSRASTGERARGRKTSSSGASVNVCHAIPMMPVARRSPAS
jgi:hypothetical protein